MRADLKQLTRKECKAVDFDKNFLSFLLVGMLTGLIFGVLWTLGMMIFAFLFEMFAGSSAVEALHALVDSVWLCVFGAFGLVSGLAMTVVMYLAGRK